MSAEEKAGQNERRKPSGKRIIVFGGFAAALVTFRGALLRQLVADGHDVTACAPDAEQTVIDALAGIGVSYRHVPLSRTGLNPLADVNTLFALIALFRELKPEILLSYTIKPVVYGSLAAKVAKVPRAYALITGAGKAFTNEQGLKHGLARSVALMLYRLSLRFNHAVIFQNPDDQAQFKAHKLVQPAQKLVIINGSGVELDQFQQAPLPHGGPSFLLIARLIKEKGIRDYAEAARRIKAAYPETVFRLVGWVDDQPGAITKDELASWEAEGIIDYLGRLQDVRPALADTSVFVLPSYYPEGTPRTVLEAMAMGRPIITTDMPGCRETVSKGKNGFLIPPKDPQALAAAIEHFIERPEDIIAFGDESRRLATDRYDVHKVNAAILNTMGLV